MRSPSESGWNEARYACSWLEERMRLARDLAGEVAREPTERVVHDVRVACRRLREAIAFFRRSGVPALGEVDRAARRLARAVGPLRVADVARDRLADLPLDDSPARSALVEQLRDRRIALARRRRSRITKRARALRQAVAAGLPVEPTERRASGAEGEAELKIALIRRLDERESEVDRLFGAIAGRDATQVTSDELHAIRVAIKHWRYATEIARAVVPRGEYRILAGKLRRLQSAGGKSQDWADVRRLIEDTYPSRRKLTPEQRALEQATAAAYRRASDAFRRALARDLTTRP